MALVQSSNSRMSAGAASVRGCLNAAGKANVDKAMSIAKRIIGTALARRLLVPHQTSAPSRTAEILNVATSCACTTPPRDARPDEDVAGDTMVPNFVKIHITMAVPSMADTHRR